MLLLSELGTVYFFMLVRDNFQYGTELSKVILIGTPSPLWIAADGGSQSITEILLDMLERCPTTTKVQSSPDGTSALEIATAHGHRGIMELLSLSKLFPREEVKALFLKFEEKSLFEHSSGYEW